VSLNKFKLKILKHNANVPSFKNSWGNYLLGINHYLGTTPNGQTVFDLGDNFADCFQGNSPAGRSQSGLSISGSAWECFVSWYLNFILWNTNVVVTKKVKSFVPQVIRDSISVNIANISTNSESDILAYTVPNSLLKTKDLNINDINNAISANIHNEDLVVIQTKTNWNDNSQVPLLWDIVYKSGINPVSNITVGQNGVNPMSFRRFAYSFVTVPTTSIPKPNSVIVSRVKNLSGGNFFGHKTVTGVARSIKEFFGHNFPSVMSSSVPNHINQNLQQHPNLLSDFLNQNF